jgi:hypothetical protein
MQDMQNQGAAMNFTKEPEDQQRHLEIKALIEYQNHNKARNNASAAFLILLPDDKFVSWSKDIQTLIKNGKCTKEDLLALIGRLNHAAAIIQLARFFLGRLRAKHKWAKHNKSIVHFNKTDTKDLELWILFLQKAHDGISLNLIAFCRLTNITCSDSWPEGVGSLPRHRQQTQQTQQQP